MDTTAIEGYGVSLGRPLGTTNRQGMVLVSEPCKYHSRGRSMVGVIWDGEQKIEPIVLHVL